MSFNVVYDDSQDSVASPAWKNIKVNSLNAKEIVIDGEASSSGVGSVLNLWVYDAGSGVDVIVPTTVPIVVNYSKIGNIVITSIKPFNLAAGAMGGNVEPMYLQTLDYEPIHDFGYLSEYKDMVTNNIHVLTTKVNKAAKRIYLYDAATKTIDNTNELDFNGLCFAMIVAP